MTQSTSQIGADQSGLAYRNADNAGKQAILNHHKGSSAPSYAEAGIIWLNDSATAWLLKVYDGADWITLGEVNATNNTFQPYNGTAVERVLNHAADTGAANAYAIAPSPAITAYATGHVVTLKPANANTSASTLNVNSLGTKNIKLLDGSNPAANALLTTGVYALVYDGTNFVVLNPSQPVFVGDSGSGGAKGLVPAPSAGDAAANKVLGAGGSWISTASSVTLNSQSAGYTLLGSDRNCIVELAGSTAQTFAFTAAATLGSGWFCFIHNNSTAALTVDPNGAETIDGVTSYIMYPGEVRLVQCSGTAFTTILLNGGTATFNSSGSWTRPPGYTAFQVEIMSGGGSGAARSTTGNAGGGGGGVLGQLLLPSASLVTVGATETVTVGGTAVGVSGNASGTAGNASSISVNGTTLQVPGPSAAATATSASAAAGGGTTGPLITFGGTIINAVQSSLIVASTIGGDVTAGNAPELNTSGYSATTCGGGAGGACSSTVGGTRTAGTTIAGGAGGAGGANTGGNGTNGTAPGGGGGGAVNGGTSGSGAAGRVVVRGII